MEKKTQVAKIKIANSPGKPKNVKHFAALSKVRLIEFI